MKAIQNRKEELYRQLPLANSSSFKGKYINYLKEQLLYASLSRRFFAFLIDFLCSSIFVSIIPMIITSIVTQEKTFSISNIMKLPLYLQVLCCTFAVFFAIYYFCIYPSQKKHLGQTLGKRVLHIKVQCQNGMDVTLSVLLKRELIGSMLLEGETAFPSAFARYLIFLWLPSPITRTLTLLSITLSIASILYCIIGKHRRMLHDIVAKTSVIDM